MFTWITEKWDMLIFRLAGGALRRMFMKNATFAQLFDLMDGGKMQSAFNAEMKRIVVDIMDYPEDERGREWNAPNHPAAAR